MEDNDQFDELLAEYDEGLAGRGTPQLRPSITDPVLELRLAEATACLDLLESALPRRASATLANGVNHTVLANVFPSPAKIGRFLIRGELGRGGHGVVFLAFDPVLKREVALKVPRPEILPSREMRSRFRREAEAAARLEHPNLIAVHEAGEIGPVCYVVSAYCPGPTLAAWLRSQSTPMPIYDAIRVVAALADAVGYMHRQGIVHRDIKPGNVILHIPTDRMSATAVVFHGSHAAIPRITDFGLAQFIDDTTAQTRTGAVLGTPGYMAPELAQGKRHCVGPPTDVYALGVLLYELLTGRTPFQTSSVMETMRQGITDDPMSPRRLRKDVSIDLETVVMKCLEKEASHRYQTAAELADELQRVISIEPIRARPVGLLGHAARWCRRRPALAILIGTTTVAILAMTIMGIARNRELSTYNHNLEQMNQSLAKSADEAREQQRLAQSYSRQFSESLYAAQMSQAELASRDGDTQELSAILDGWSSRPDHADLRGFEYWYLQNCARLKDRQLLFSAKSAIYNIVRSPDQKTIAAAGKDGTLWLFDETTGDLTGTIETGQIEVNGIAFRTDVREVATTGDDGTIRFWNLDSKQQRLSIQAYPRKAYQIVFTKDGSSIISCGNNPEIRAFNSATGELQYVLHGHEGEVDSLALDDDGQTMISTGFDTSYRVWDLSSRTQTKRYYSNHQTSPVAISQRPHLFVVGSHAGTFEVIRLPDGEILGRVDQLDRLKSLAVHPEGTFVASGNGTGSIRIWRLDPDGKIETKHVAIWHAHPGGVESLIWSTDGKYLLSAGDDGQVVRWSLAAALNPPVKKFPIDWCMSGCLIPQTDLLITSGISLDIWSLKSGAHRSTVTDMRCHSPSISSDGRLIVVLADERTLHVFRWTGNAGSDPQYEPLAQWDSEAVLSNPRIAPDARSVAVCRWVRGDGNSDNEHAVWMLSLPDLNSRQKLSPVSVSQMQYSRNSESLLLHPRDELGMWNLKSNEWLWRVPQLDAELLTFSDDGNQLYTRIGGRGVIVRRTSDGQEIMRTSTHRGSVSHLAATVDGRTLATTDSDGVLRLTHLPTGRTLFDLISGGSGFRMIEFSADGQRLVCIQQVDPDDAQSQVIIFEAMDTKHDFRNSARDVPTRPDRAKK